MTIHRTATGYVELLTSWGHGRGVQPNYSRPATLVTDDGDGHYQQWRYTGKLKDALVTLARLERSINGGDHVAFRSGAGYYVERAPEDFWMERDGEMIPDLTAHPDAIAW